jgi:hypothetical protein
MGEVLAHGPGWSHRIERRPPNNRIAKQVRLWGSAQVRRLVGQVPMMPPSSLVMTTTDERGRPPGNTVTPSDSTAN